MNRWWSAAAAVWIRNGAIMTRAPKRDGERNEALETFVYASAALEISGLAQRPNNPLVHAARVSRSTLIRSACSMAWARS